MNELAVTFESSKEQLLGIVHQSKKESDIGVVVVVGGPQYRVGSHRQFVQLARAFAKADIPCFRFDYSGMGDSDGVKKEFDNIDADIKAAVDTFLVNQPHIKRVVVWGLCDAASAALIYAHQDSRVKGLVLLNPWLRSEQAMGKTMLKFYYIKRILSKSFWQKLLSGKVKVAESISDVKGFTQASMANTHPEKQGYQAKMLFGFNKFKGRIAIILSGNDLTAKEFSEQVLVQKAWKKVHSDCVKLHQIERANHTFSSEQSKRKVEQISVHFVSQIG